MTRSLGECQRGQAIIEYVLLLVIVVSLFYGLSKTFFEPLQKYGSSVFTNTIACSFEYGQLPSEIISEDGCAAKYQGGKLSSNSTQRQSNKNVQSSKKDSEKDQKAQSPIATSESSNSSGAGRSTTIYSKGNALQLGKNSGSEGKAITKNQSFVNETGNKIEFSDSDSSGRRGRRPILKPITGELETIIINQKKKKSGEINRSIASSIDSSEHRVKKFAVNNKKKDGEKDGDQKPWDFYMILRVVLIFLMILVIIVFVFFQLSQIRRGNA